MALPCTSQVQPDVNDLSDKMKPLAQPKNHGAYTKTLNRKKGLFFVETQKVFQSFAELLERSPTSDEPATACEKFK